MLHFMRLGGTNMWFLMIIGLVMVVSAIKFARAADPHRLALLRALSFAIIIMSITGFCSGLIKTFLFVADMPDAVLDRLPTLCQGIGESTANLVLGGGFVSVAWILIAVGVRRMPSVAS